MSSVIATASWDKPLRCNSKTLPPGQLFCTKALPRKWQWESKALSWDIKLENLTNVFMNCLGHYFKRKFLSSQQIKWFFSEETDF